MQYKIGITHKKQNLKLQQKESATSSHLYFLKYIYSASLYIQTTQLLLFGLSEFILTQGPRKDPLRARAISRLNLATDGTRAISNSPETMAKTMLSLETDYIVQRIRDLSLGGSDGLLKRRRHYQTTERETLLICAKEWDKVCFYSSELLE